MYVLTIRMYGSNKKTDQKIPDGLIILATLNYQFTIDELFSNCFLSRVKSSCFYYGLSSVTNEKMG